MAEVFAVVLAAGKGTRMKSDKAKVLHEVSGKPMLAHVLETLRVLGVDRAVSVVGHQAEAVTELCRTYDGDTVLQAEQLGTGHAVEQTRSLLEGLPGYTLVLSGDVPLLSVETLAALRDKALETEAGAVVLTAIAEDASGYGRMLRDVEGRVVGIVEHKDADEAQRSIREYNTGTYCFDNEKLWPLLAKLDTDNAQGELYLTDVIEMLVSAGSPVEAVICEDEREVQGVNTVDDLARVERDWEALHRG